MKNLVYSVGKRVGGDKVLKYLARNHPRILMYHRIRSSVDGDGMHIDIFRQQMELLKKEFNVVSLSELLKLINNKKSLPKDAVIITFDDGYADFYENAFPILNSLSLPSTLFITTGFVSNETWLWPDKIKYILSSTEKNEFSVPEIERSFSLKEDENIAWHAIADYCLTITDKHKHQFIHELAKRLEVDVPRNATDMFKPLNWTQVKEMELKGVEIGSHSISHPVMTKLDKQELYNEVVTSKKLIEGHIKRPVKGFCYPNGLSEDINNEVKDIIKQAGYLYAIAAFPSETPFADRWEIKRYPASSDINEFEKIIYGLRYQRLRTN